MKVNEVKSLADYLALPYRMELIEDKVEGGFVVRFPELPGCITSGVNLAEAYENAMDAKEAWLVAAMEDNLPIPEPVDVEDYSGQFKLRMPKSLHKALAEHSRREGISMNQYCLYLLARNDALMVKV